MEKLKMKNGKRTRSQLNKSAILEGAVQFSSVGLTIYLVDARGYPFLDNSRCTHANVFPSAILGKQILDI